MRNQVIFGVVILVILIVGGFIYFQSQQSLNTTPANNTTTSDSVNTTVTSSPTTQTSPATGSSEVQTGSVKEFTVTTSGFRFTPNEIMVNKGDRVKITFKNTGGTHDFVIDEFNVKTNVISGGQEETVEFTADKAGTFEFYCSVMNHRAQGMKGTLTVQ